MVIVAETVEPLAEDLPDEQAASGLELADVARGVGVAVTVPARRLVAARPSSLPFPPQLRSPLAQSVRCAYSYETRPVGPLTARAVPLTRRGSTRRSRIAGVRVRDLAVCAITAQSDVHAATQSDLRSASGLVPTTAAAYPLHDWTDTVTRCADLLREMEGQSSQACTGQGVV